MHTERRYDVLLCDADNTIFDFGRAEEIAFAQACAAMGLAGTPEQLATYSRINEALWKLLERGGITQAALRVRRFVEFLQAIGRPELDAQAMADAFVDALGRQSVPMPGAVDAVRRWSARLPVVIVTNGIARVQHGRMAHSAVRPFIRGMIVSEEIGAAKPDPRMLQAGMELVGVNDPRRALMLGDSLTSDIAAANNAGVDSCWLNPKGAPCPVGVHVTYTIQSLDEVDALLEEVRG